MNPPTVLTMGRSRRARVVAAPEIETQRPEDRPAESRPNRRREGMLWVSMLGYLTAFGVRPGPKSAVGPRALGRARGRGSARPGFGRPRDPAFPRSETAERPRLAGSGVEITGRGRGTTIPAPQSPARRGRAPRRSGGSRAEIRTDLSGARAPPLLPHPREPGEVGTGRPPTGFGPVASPQPPPPGHGWR